MGLVFVDVEGGGPSPALGETMTEFGAVAYPEMLTFHGIMDEMVPTIWVFTEFDAWLKASTKGQPVFVSDNPAYDWQWINYYFWKYLGRNPFGHSARRISDYYAGLTGNWSNTQKWKRLRVTKHDHNPVHDALGNAEAFARLQKGER